MSKKNYPLVELLLSLKNSENRAKIAALRRGASDPFNNFEALSIIGKTIPDQNDNTFKNSMLLATIFAEHPKHIDNQSIGDALRKVRYGLSVGAESLDARFIQLLNSDFEDLPHYLLQTCRFLANKDVGIDFHILFDDIQYWTHQDKFVQLKWAKDYWGYKEKPDNQEITKQSNFINNKEN